MTSQQNQHQSETKAEKAEHKAADAKAEATRTEQEAEAKRSAKAKTATPPRAKLRTMPAGGTIIPAAPGYSVLTAVKPADDPAAALTFPPSLVVIAWSIGADGAAWPITAIPPSEHVIDVGTVHTNGAVVDQDGTVHAGPVEWQAAVRTREATAEPAAPPVNVTAPYLSQTGDLLSCTMGTWADPAPAGYAYSWQKNGVAVTGSAAQYTITGADVGSTMTCTVTASNAVGSTESVSNPLVVAAQ